MKEFCNIVGVIFIMSIIIESLNWINETVGIAGLILVTITAGTWALVSIRKKYKKLQSKLDVFETRLKQNLENSIGNYGRDDIDIKNKLNTLDSGLNLSMTTLTHALGSAHDPISQKQVTIHGMVEAIKKQQDAELKKQEQFLNTTADYQMKQSKTALNILSYTMEQIQALTLENNQLTQENERLKIQNQELSQQQRNQKEHREIKTKSQNKNHDLSL